MGKRILIAPDKFKGSLSGQEICSILKNEFTHEIPDLTVETCPLADGGDGSIEILSAYLEIKEKVCDTVDPLGRPIKASYFYSENAAYIELAAASGLVRLKKEERNPMYTSTYGTGLLIKDALEMGLTNIYLFLGGSSTNDGGIGIASALGYQFLDATGMKLKPIGGNLQSIESVEVGDVEVNFEKFTICCDVTNPPFGPRGSAHVYGKQKGANPSEIEILDQGIQNLCHLLNDYVSDDISKLSGGGAAGGTALSPSAFFGGKIISGMDFIGEVTQLESKIAKADIVISGEGKLDLQSIDGKVVSGVAHFCKKYGKELWLVVGKNDLSKEEFEAVGATDVFAIIDYARDLDDAMLNSKEYLTYIGREMANRITK